MRAIDVFETNDVRVHVCECGRTKQRGNAQQIAFIMLYMARLFALARGFGFARARGVYVDAFMFLLN